MVISSTVLRAPYMSYQNTEHQSHEVNMVARNDNPVGNVFECLFVWDAVLLFYFVFCRNKTGLQMDPPVSLGNSGLRYTHEADSGTFGNII